jgi:curved DNA-binding protein CbpA
MAMDDYYELLDVAPDSDREDIRIAFRDKRDALQAGEDGGAKNRAKVAELNRAWNVLSDPHQRERYDERLADYRESRENDGEGDEDGDYDDDDHERPVPVTRAQKRAELRRQRGATAQQQTIVLPEGLTLAPVKARLQALAFDLLVLLLIFLAVYLIGLKLVDNHFPGERKRGSDLVTQQTKATKAVNADKKKVSDADKAITAARLKKDTQAETKATADANAAKAAQKKDQANHDAITKRVDAINKQLSPWINLVFVVGILLLLLYLVPATALTGQTPGKRIFKVRAVNRITGEAPGFSSAVLRFGVPLLIGAFLAVPLRFGPLGLAIPVLGMIGWISKPNRQGMHDKLAKTVVVEA